MKKVFRKELIISALVLAERGCKTLIVERLNCLGGTSTAGQIDGYYFGNRNLLLNEAYI